MREGLFTKEQEAKLDKLIKFKNPILEGLDGPAISLIDNQGLNVLTKKLATNNPDLWPVITGVIDVIFEAIPGDLETYSQPPAPGHKPPPDDDDDENGND